MSSNKEENISIDATQSTIKLVKVVVREVMSKATQSTVVVRVEMSKATQSTVN